VKVNQGIEETLSGQYESRSKKGILQNKTKQNKKSQIQYKARCEVSS
jgi:hypothetical protein